jgi:hypothetical protein
MPKTAIKIGPQDHGRRMSLADFDHAEVQEGYLYELSRGVITVSDVPDLRHLGQVDEVRQQFDRYRAAYPGQIYRLAAGSDCKIMVTGLESERHPDIAIYRRPPTTRENLWYKWIPDIVIEVVSASSEYRDYHEKPPEYLAFGVREYWIIDADKEEVLVLRRRGKRWTERVLGPMDVYQTPLLPGFEFACAPVFAAADN